MALQTTFYLVGIIANVLLIIFLIGIAVMLFVIKQKVTQIYDMVNDKVEVVKEVVTHPKEFAAGLGAAVAHNIFVPKKHKYSKRR